MVYPRVKLGFSSQKNSDLVRLARNVVFNIDKNAALFQETVVQANQRLKESLDEFRILVDAANSRSAVDIEARNTYRPTFVSTIDFLAKLINTLYAGNGTILEMTGFNILKGRVTHSLGKITTVDVKNGVKKGEVDLRVQGAANTGAVGVEYTTDNPTDPNAKWKFMVSIKKNFSLAGFSFNQPVTMKVTAYGKDNTSSNTVVVRWASS